MQRASIDLIPPPNQPLSEQSQGVEKCTSGHADCTQYEGPDFDTENTFKGPHIDPIPPSNQSPSKLSESIEKHTGCCTDHVQYGGPNFSIENMFKGPHINPIPPPNQPLSIHCKGFEKQTFEEEEESSDDLEQAILSLCHYVQSQIPDGNNWDAGGIEEGVSPVEGRCKLSRWGAEWNCTTEEEKESSSESSK